MIGFFVNTLVLRTDLSGNLTGRELVQRVREVALGAYAHQELPFEKLVDELQVERSLSHAPLFQVLFALQNTSQELLELPGLSLSAAGEASGVAKFDLTVNVSESGDAISGCGNTTPTCSTRRPSAGAPFRDFSGKLCVRPGAAPVSVADIDRRRSFG